MGVRALGPGGGVLWAGGFWFLWAWAGIVSILDIVYTRTLSYISTSADHIDKYSERAIVPIAADTGKSS